MGIPKWKIKPQIFDLIYFQTSLLGSLVPRYDTELLIYAKLCFSRNFLLLFNFVCKLEVFQEFISEEEGQMAV